MFLSKTCETRPDEPETNLPHTAAADSYIHFLENISGSDVSLQQRTSASNVRESPDWELRDAGNLVIWAIVGIEEVGRVLNMVSFIGGFAGRLFKSFIEYFWNSNEHKHWTGVREPNDFRRRPWCFHPRLDRSASPFQEAIWEEKGHQERCWSV